MAAAQTIPDAYRGVWRNIFDQVDCKHSDWNGPAHADSHIKVDAREVELAEARCTFRSVKASPYQDVRLQMSCMREGTADRATEIWSVHEMRGQKLLVITNPGKKEIPTAVYQFCAKDGSAEIESPQPQMQTAPTFETLPRDVQAYVSEVRGRCQAILDEIPEKDRQGLNYLPSDPMQGIRYFQLAGKPVIIADNFELCTSDVPGANCSNRGCDLVIWREDNSDAWRRIFQDHLYGRVALDLDAQQLQSMKVSIQADDGRCRPSSKRNYTSGESCNLVARFKNGAWEYQRVK